MEPNEHVMVLQRRLVGLGYDIGRSGPTGDGVDGDYGPKTAEADQAGLEVRSLEYLGPQVWGTSSRACALAELRSGGQHYILRAITQAEGAICVKADFPHPGET